MIKESEIVADWLVNWCDNHLQPDDTYLSIFLNPVHESQLPSLRHPIIAIKDNTNGKHCVTMTVLAGVVKVTDFTKKNNTGEHLDLCDPDSLDKICCRLFEILINNSAAKKTERQSQLHAFLVAERSKCHHNQPSLK